MNEVKTTNVATELPSKIEVTKHTQGFTWTIGIRCEDGKEASVVDRIEQINNDLVQRFKAEV